MPESKKIVAFFDFDGTLVDLDVFVEFLKFYLRKTRPIYKAPKLVFILTLYATKVWNNDRAKEAICELFFSGMSIEYFRQIAAQFYAERSIKIRPSLEERIAEFRSRNAELFIVTANFDLLLEPFVIEHPYFNIMSTTLEIENGILTGKFEGANNYGPEKVRRIKTQIPNLASYAEIHAFGDSTGDKAMLELATHPYYRSF